MKPLIYSPATRADLDSIADDIAGDNPCRSLTFIDELERKAQQAVERPRSFHPRDDIPPKLRSIVHHRYLILFRELDDIARVERIVDGAMDLSRPALI
jgi:plasmid stabilization system protein ParE